MKAILLLTSNLYMYTPFTVKLLPLWKCKYLLNQYPTHPHLQIPENHRKDTIARTRPPCIYIPISAARDVYRPPGKTGFPPSFAFFPRLSASASARHTARAYKERNSLAMAGERDVPGRYLMKTVTNCVSMAIARREPRVCGLYPGAERGIHLPGVEICRGGVLGFLLLELLVRLFLRKKRLIAMSLVTCSDLHYLRQRCNHLGQCSSIAKRKETQWFHLLICIVL